METSVINNNYNDFANQTRMQNKFNDQIFKKAYRQVKGTEVRDADWACYAAQNCLVRQMVDADENELDLIIKKMDYLNNHMNGNLKLDNDINLSERRLKNEVLPAKAELNRARGEAFSNIINSSAGAIKDTLPVVHSLSLIG